MQLGKIDYYGVRQTLNLPQRALGYMIGIALAKVVSIAFPFWLELLLSIACVLLTLKVIKSIQLKDNVNGKNTTIYINSCVFILWILLGMFRLAGAVWPEVNSTNLFDQRVSGKAKIISVQALPPNDRAVNRFQLQLKMKDYGPNGHEEKNIENIWRKQKKILLIIEFPKNIASDQLQPESLVPSAQIAFDGRVIKNMEPRNPGAFNYPDYLAAQGIFCRVETNSEKVGINQRANIAFIMLRKLQQELLQQIDKNLPKVEAGIVAGCLLGKTDGMAPEDLTAYRQAGIAHLFAVSGTHGSIILALVVCLNSLWPGVNSFWRRWLLSIGFLYFYTALTGFTLSMIRTLVMCIIILSADLFDRKGERLTALAAAFILILWMNPNNLQLAGFQLSFGVSFGILHLYPWLKKRRVNTYLAGGLAAQLAGMPLQSFWFNQFQPFSSLINLVVILFMGPLMLLSLAAALLSQISNSLAAWLWWISGFIAYMMHKISIFWAALPWSCWPIASQAWPFYIFWGIGLYLLPELIYYYQALGNWLKFINRNKLWAKRKYLLLILIVIFVYVISFRNNPLEVVFLDVGEGDCAVIHTPKGKVWLVDGGGTPFSDFQVGNEILLPYLHQRGVRKIEGVFLSHHHQDHREGIAELLRSMPIKAIWMPSIQEGAKEDQDFEKALEQSKVKVNIISTAKQQFQIEQNLKVNIWWPQAWAAADQLNNWLGNNSSIIIRLTCHDKLSNISWLFTGDIEVLAMQTLLANIENQELQAEVLKLPHHGSKTSYLSSFYKAVKPKAIVVTGGKNKTGNLAEEVKTWFENANIPIWSTRRSGAIITNLRDKRMITVRTMVDK